ncbi:Phosphatidate cytidylyltransferase [Candidatus Riesia pediculischaeffi PTSU]|nr:Phosphatidate cytidylyltransferase [Candidatus Riesia pediculischaeffi PTSU]
MMNKIIKIILMIWSTWWIFAIALITTFPRSSKIWGNSSILKSLFYILTIFPFNFCVLFLKDIRRSNHQTIGNWMMLYVILLVWIFDISSYIFGTVFGKKKLAINVSPNKTIEGVLCGLICSQIFSWIFCATISIFELKVQIFISSLIVIVISIFGDLLSSMFKREIGIKDTGHIIPGHGGILDRIDSLVAAIPAFITVLKLFYRL